MRNNESLLEKARAGDQEAIHDLMRLYHVDIKRMAFSQCENNLDAQDAAQESLLIMHEKIGTLRTVAAFPGWLFTIIRHECHRLMHGRRRWNLMEEATGPEEPAASDKKSMRFDIASAIAALNEIDRQLIIHCHIEQRQVSEAASLLGISKAAAKSRLQRARQVLRRRLRAYAPVDRPTPGADR